MRAQIIGTGSYVPEKVMTNDDLAKIVDTSDEWITERTGIKARHVAADGENTSDMAVKASQRALELAGVSPKEVDMIVLGTVTGDMPMPATAAFVQAKLGATNAFAFDVSAACAGSVYAMAVAEKFIRTGAVKRALVIGAELLTRIIDWQDRNTCVLFGDAAGAMVLAPTDDPDRGILSTHLYTEGAATDILCIPGGGSKFPFSEAVLAEKLNKVKMNGREVFKIAVRSLASATETALRVNGLTPANVDHVIAHQANIRILESVLQRLEIPMDKAWLNIHKYGNTSSASLPITLDEANRAGKLKQGEVLAMMAIGAGMSWGSAAVRW
ncbi:MAG: beta-ketoacyl-ACP synthase III [Myxococcales bacterium]